MNRATYLALFIIGLASISWALWLTPGENSNFERIGYGLSGVLSVSSALSYWFKKPRLASAVGFIGAMFYLNVPAGTVSWLIVTGDWKHLFDLLRSAASVPTRLEFTTVQSVSWHVDLFFFQVAVPILFFFVAGASILSAVCWSCKKLQRGHA